MRKFLVLGLICLSALSVSANNKVMNKLYMNANCFVNGGVNAVCEACNYSYNRPVRCAMQIRGMSSRGFWFNGNQFGVLYPGQCMNGYVYANNPYVDPLVDANASVNCQF